MMRKKRKKVLLISVPYNQVVWTTQITSWRIEVTPFHPFAEPSYPPKPTITIPLLYRDMGMVIMPEKGVPSHIRMSRLSVTMTASTLEKCNRETMQPSHVSLWLRPDTGAKGEQGE